MHWALLGGADLQLLFAGDRDIGAQSVLGCIQFAGFAATSPVPGLFAELLRGMSSLQLRRLLLLLTQLDSLPVPAPKGYITVRCRKAGESDLLSCSLASLLCFRFAGQQPSVGRRSAADVDKPTAQPALRSLELVDCYPAGATGLARLKVGLRAFEPLSQFAVGLQAELETCIAEAADSQRGTNVDALLKAAAPFYPTLCVLCQSTMGKHRFAPSCAHYLCDDTACVQGFSESDLAFWGSQAALIWCALFAVDMCLEASNQFPARCPGCTADDSKYGDKQRGEVRPLRFACSLLFSGLSLSAAICRSLWTSFKATSNASSSAKTAANAG